MTLCCPADTEWVSHFIIFHGFLVRVCKPRPGGPLPRFLDGLWVNNGFYICKRLKWKIKTRIIFCDMWKWYQIQMSASVSKVLWEFSHAHLFTCCPWLLSFRDIWEKTDGLQSLKYLLSGLLRKKSADPCSTKWIPTQVSVVILYFRDVTLSPLHAVGHLDSSTEIALSLFSLKTSYSFIAILSW